MKSSVLRQETEVEFKDPKKFSPGPATNQEHRSIMNSGICGWISTESVAREPGSIAAAMSTAFPSDRSIVEIHSGAGVIAASGSVAARLYKAEGWLGAVLGAPRRAGSAFDFGEFARDHAKNGRDAFSRLHGAFAIALVHPERNEAVLAIDRGGIQALAWAPIPGGIVFGSNLASLGAHPDVDQRISRQSLYDYVYFHMIPGPETVYAKRTRLVPAECLHYRNGTVSTSVYWSMRFEEHVARPFEELRDEFRSTIRGAVERLVDGRSVGAFLSGGTDSSTVAGMLGAVTGAPARTFSIGFAADGYDETSYARMAAAHFNTRHREYYVTADDIVNSVGEIARTYDQPFGNSSVVPTYFCARLARSEGIEHLLAGDGGDELFGGNERYATQHLFSLYGRIPGPLRKSILEPIARTIPTDLNLPGLRQYRRLIELCTMHTPDRLMVYNLLEQFGANNVFTSDFLADIDTGHPITLMRQPFDRAHAQALINRMLALDLKITLADNDLPKVMGACSLAGLAVGFPMLDDEVVAFSAKLEPELKLKGTKLRYFFKEALRGFLPDEILRKQKHGFGLPFGPWLRTHPPLRELVTDALEGLAKRGIVRRSLIDDLLGPKLNEHAGYYGTMAWVLMMLELWMRSRSNIRLR